MVFESWATSPRAVMRDDSLAFEAEALKQACETWKEIADGAIPPRSRFSARAVKAFLGHMVIFECLSESDYRVRLMGTRITNIIGEMQGKRLIEALPDETVLHWCAELNAVLAQRQPLRVVTTVNLANLQFLEAEIFLAPLSDSQGQVTMVMAVVVFRSGLTKTISITGVVGAAE